MNLPKLSIIIPVKDEARFITRCLDSIVNQNSDDIEVIVIDDGSTDGTTEIMKDYYDISNFNFYRADKSKGVSSARNAGILKARGEYITFLDADDQYIDKAIKIMLKATELNRDVVQFNHYKCLEGQLMMSRSRNNTAGIYSITNRPNSYCMVWNKIYRHKFIEDNSITFKEGLQFGEDELFNIKCMLETDIYCVRKVTVVKHFDNRMSICHRLTPERVHRQDEILVSLYWGLQYRGYPKEKCEAVKEIIREHRSSKLYQNVGLELLK